MSVQIRHLLITHTIMVNPFICLLLCILCNVSIYLSFGVFKLKASYSKPFAVQMTETHDMILIMIFYCKHSREGVVMR